MNDYEVKSVASALHDLLCNYNHTDQCGWLYHPNNWEESTHNHYFLKAMKLIESGPGINWRHAIAAISEVKRG